MTTMKNITEIESAEHPKVWDLPVRVFHWTLVTAVIWAFVTNRLGVSFFKYHVWFGYAVIVAVSFRILWGVVGSHHALFHKFVRGPVETLRYGLGLAKGRHRHYAGHNPLGAVMVVALLAALAVQAGAGLFGNDEIFNVGPLNGYVSNDLSLMLTSLHRRLFYGIAAAVGLHVLAVLVHTVFFKEGLVQAMFTGRKPVKHLHDVVGVKYAPTWLALALCIGLGVGLAVVVSTAPLPVQEQALND